MNRISESLISLPVAILAGGLATRLRPLTEKIPKSLVTVAGRPFIDWQLELLARQGIREVVLCTGHLGEMIENHVGDGGNFGLTVDYSSDGETLRGTGGAIRHALPKLGPTFFILYGDSYLTADYRAVAAAFQRSKQPALMTVYRNENTGDRSNVAMEEDRIIQYSKTEFSPRMHHIDYGLSIARAELFTSHAEDLFDLAGLYTGLVQTNNLAAFEVLDRFYEIGSVAGIADLERHLTQS